MKILFSLLTLALITISSTANALVFIEPMLGYAQGKYTAKYLDAMTPSNSFTEDLDFKGLNYGVRGGFEFGWFQLGLDYIINDMKMDDGKQIDVDEEFDVTETAALLGFRFWFARLYLGYIFSAEVKDSELDDGTGYKAGLSFYALENLALNLEYRFVDLDGSGFDHEYGSTALLVSFPFSI